jgi:DnaD/phage-associated family protein
MTDNASNNEFTGFPARMQFTPVPNVFLGSLLPQIDDPAELKVTLLVFASVYRKKGYPRFVTVGELLADRGIQLSLGSSPETLEPALRGALSAAVTRGTLRHVSLERGGELEDLYFINDEAGRQAIAKIEGGELVIPGRKISRTPPPVTGELPDIFTLYEQNIGMLTPMIADEIREAIKQYPESWLREAIKEAVDLNKRNWRYIAAIMERWSTEGKGSGTSQRDTKKTDPDKYVKGKYGHMVRR